MYVLQVKVPPHRAGPAFLGEATTVLTSLPALFTHFLITGQNPTSPPAPWRRHFGSYIKGKKMSTTYTPEIEFVNYNHSRIAWLLFSMPWGHKAETTTWPPGSIPQGTHRGKKSIGCYSPKTPILFFEFTRIIE